MRNLFSTLLFHSPGVLGMNRRNIDMILPKNQRRHFPLANNKLLTKSILAEAQIPVAPTLATYESFYQIGEMENQLSELREFVIKPARGSGGNGILVVADRKNDYYATPGGRLLSGEDLRKHIADIVFGVYSFDKADVAIVEPRLKPDDFFAELYPHGLSDIRLLMVENVPTLCMLRVPTMASDGRANLHQGAIGIAIDTNSGVTRRAWHKRQEIDVHPENGVQLVDCQVPRWRRIVDIATQTAQTLPLKYLGVDMVVDQQRGPVVLEVNARPGIEIQNVTGRSLLDVLAEQDSHRDGGRI